MQPVPTPFTEILIKHLLSKLLIQKRGKLQAPEFGTAQLFQILLQHLSAGSTPLFTTTPAFHERQKLRSTSNLVLNKNRPRTNMFSGTFFFINLSYRNINCTNTQKTNPDPNWTPHKMLLLCRYKELLIASFTGIWASNSNHLEDYIVYFKIPSQSGRFFIINHLRVHNYVLRGFFIIIINEAK